MTLQIFQARNLGEMGILGTFLSRDYCGTILPIFSKISSHLTDMEQRISRHSLCSETGCTSTISCRWQQQSWVKI